MSLLPNTRRKGFTLIELMVAVSVLAIVIAITNMILGQSQRVVRVSEARMRSNATAAALAKVFRRDFRELTCNGMLCITDPGLDGTRPTLILVKTTSSQSLTSSDANYLGSPFTVVSYGMCFNSGNTSGAIPSILWRRQVLAATTPPSTINDWDDFRALPPQLRGSRADFITLIRDPNYAGLTTPCGSLRYPPGAGTGGTDIKYAWQIATPYCTNLSIQWAYSVATPTKALTWYGVNQGTAAPSGSYVAVADANLVESTAMGTYTALWSAHSISAWPAAVKIRFTLCDPTMPIEFINDNATTRPADLVTKTGYGATVLDYEVICPVGE